MPRKGIERDPNQQPLPTPIGEITPQIPDYLVQKPVKPVSTPNQIVQIGSKMFTPEMIREIEESERNDPYWNK